MRLAADEYYVLGDNSPVSEDSRTWPDGGAIDAKLLVGKPLVAIPSVLIAPWWDDRDFQVPRIWAEIRQPLEWRSAGIRYIRQSSSMGNYRSIRRFLL